MLLFEKKKVGTFFKYLYSPLFNKAIHIKKEAIILSVILLLLGFCCKRSLFETQIKVDVSLISKEPVRLYLLRLRCQMQTSILFKFVYTCIFFSFVASALILFPKKAATFQTSIYHLVLIISCSRFRVRVS